jgi:hypothetical protein
MSFLISAQSVDTPPQDLVVIEGRFTRKLREVSDCNAEVLHHWSQQHSLLFLDIWLHHCLDGWVDVQSPDFSLT